MHLGEPVTVTATVEVLETIPDAVFEFGLSTADGVRVATLHNIDEGRPPAALEPGRHEVRAELDLTLIPGEYALDLGLSRQARGATVDLVERVVRVRALARRRRHRSSTRWPSRAASCGPEASGT